jgi:hypothetical protein
MSDVLNAALWAAVYCFAGPALALSPAMPLGKTADLSISTCLSFLPDDVTLTSDSEKSIVNLLSLAKTGDFKLFLSQKYYQAVVEGKPTIASLEFVKSHELAKRRAVTTFKALIDRTHFQAMSLRMVPDIQDWQWIRLGSRCGPQSLLLANKQVKTYFFRTTKWIDPKVCDTSDTDSPADLPDCEIFCTEQQCLRDTK